MSAWVDDPSRASGFRWDRDAPSVGEEPAVTRFVAYPDMHTPSVPAAVDPNRMPPETEHRHGGQL